MSNFPTPPAARIPYDLDGTAVVVGPGFSSDWTPFNMSPAGVAAMNSDHSSTAFVVNWRSASMGTGYYNVNSTGVTPLTVDPLPWVCLLFPRPMELNAVFVHILPAAEGYYISPYMDIGEFQPFLLQTSSDSTNGIDGTWHTVLDVNSPQTSMGYGNYPAAVLVSAPGVTNGLPGVGPVVNENYRRAGGAGKTGWQLLTGSGLRNVVAVRMLVDRTPAGMYDNNGLRFSGMLCKLHLYGAPELDYDPHRLEIQSSVGIRSDLDFGDVPQDSSSIKTFSVVNLSDALTATGVSVLVDVTNPVPPLTGTVADTELSLDGTLWATSVDLPDLAPLSRSQDIWIRVSTPSTSLLGNWAPRLIARAEEWS